MASAVNELGAYEARTTPRTSLALRHGLGDFARRWLARVAVPAALSFVSAPALAWDAIEESPSYSDPSTAYPYGACVEDEAIFAREELACFAGPGPAAPRASQVAVIDPTARRAYDAMRAHRAAGRVDDALVSLASLRALAPTLSDHWDGIEGELVGHGDRACDAFERASESPLSSVAAHARVGRVRCAIARGDRTASAQLTALLRRYPELSEATSLRMGEAAMLEASGQRTRAIAIWRSIDLALPETAAAGQAREQLERARSEGARVTRYTPAEIVARMDRLVRIGAPDLARGELEQLREVVLPRAERAQITLIEARLARVEGRFDAAAELVRQARVAGGPSTAADAAQALEASAAASEAEARAELRRLMGASRRLDTVPTTRLFAYLRVAAQARLTDAVDAALDALETKPLPCGLRLQAAILASGSGDDARIESSLATCAAHPDSIGTASRYHRGRALERLGRTDAARAELLAVLEQDRSDTKWYSMWSRQRLRVLEAVPETPRADASDLFQGELFASAKTEESSTTSPAVLAPEATAPRWPDVMPQGDVEPALAAIAAQHGAAYPWFERALVFLRLGDAPAAADELHEAYLAWHEASGRAPLRAGVEAVYRGAAPPRIAASSFDVWRDRRQLDAASRIALGEIAAALGEYGLSIRFLGPERASYRPRAYEELVVEAARERGIDPNLLLAVMRVESVYNPRIVSYAGAVGLLQIMPRTGNLIARALGRTEFGTDELLDPRTNIGFGAWYLASLLRRFDGRVPLAVAAYNGGPHNVRRWIAEFGAHMPLDAFLERIPFDQTHRYVRRVLGHWAAYRAQDGLGMPALDANLPRLGPDRVAF